MGIDCKVSLPANVRIDDVASVIGRLLGCDATKQPLQGGSYTTEVKGVKTEGCGFTAECARILIRDDEKNICYDSLYHFESRGGRRAIILRSTAENICLFCELVNFFGGNVDYNDCDDCADNYVQPDRSNEENHAEDGVAWESLQHRIFKVKPLTAEQIDACEQYAAYKKED